MLQFLNKQKTPILTAICAAFGAAAVVSIIYYIIYPAGASFHSDCTDTIYWAQASYESGKLFDPDFNYAAMLPFGGSLLMLPFLGSLGVSMATHTIGMILFVLLFFASLFFMCRSLSFEPHWTFLCVGTVAMILSLSEKLREIFFEHVIYYSLAAIFIYVMLGLSARIIKGVKCKGFWLYSAVLLVFSALVATDGLQLVATAIIPILIALAGERILDSGKKLTDAGGYYHLACIGITVAGCVSGLILLRILSNGITAGYANAYSNYSSMTDWLAHVTALPEQWLRLLGVDIADGEPLFSGGSIVEMIKIALAILLGIIPVVALFFYKKLGKDSRLLLLAHWGLTAVILFGYVFGDLSAANWRLSPIIATGIPVCIMCFRTAITFSPKKYGTVKRLCAVSLCFFIAASAVGMRTVYALPKYGIAENEGTALSEMLERHGLNYGYATFWNSQRTTVISDSAVKVRTITVDGNGIFLRDYQSSKKWFLNQPGVDKYFIVLTPSEAALLSESGLFERAIDLADETFSEGIYFVLVFYDNPFASQVSIP